MYTYIIRTCEPEYPSEERILHEKEFTGEEFREMVAECFALAIKEECDEIASYMFKETIEDCISLDSRLYRCANIMVEKYGFIESQQPTQVFSVDWYIERNKSGYNGELIFKHIDKLLNE